MTGSRFPGSRVIASDHLPRDLASPVVLMVDGYPPTVAGAAAELPAKSQIQIQIQIQSEIMAGAPHSLG